ncbi:afea2de1-2cd3-48b2-9252-5f2f4f95be8c [Thermothielavioides terrestris]|uniref:Afea2de1-2cd3-48b2-9252-5f2f4f95be8c n=1 Tax=Thermothielavioides terrestris TaxID=2587410 RepID=A0A3S4EYS1_9PEZI|nr:afea2de1-2cd3-48b2-9252-5f2f4f95be8c [Thermothielavioides terrestris]
MKQRMPSAYSGHRSNSLSTCHSRRGVTASRLCMSPLDGSSRSTRLTTMATSLSVNQPLGRNHVLVCTAEAGIMKKDARPTLSVIRPSTRNSHLQPAQPCTPRRWRRANASSEVMIVVSDSVVQK